MRIASLDDVIAMKLVAGRSGDIDDVAALTSRGEAPSRTTRTVSAALPLAEDADPQWASDLLRSRLLESDDGAEIRLEGRRIELRATRSDLTREQLRQWAHALAHRLRGAGLLDDGEVEVVIEGPGGLIWPAVPLRCATRLW